MTLEQHVVITLSDRIMEAIVNSDCFCKPGDPTCEDWRNSEHRWETIHAAVMRVVDEKPVSESNLVNHARREMELVGEDPEWIEGILKVIQAFADMGHSGGSASFAIPLINALLQFKNLSPLTDDPEEWMHISEDIATNDNTWQNRRNSEAFSNDGGKTYYLLSESNTYLHQRPIHHSKPKEG